MGVRFSEGPHLFRKPSLTSHVNAPKIDHNALSRVSKSAIEKRAVDSAPTTDYHGGIVVGTVC